MKINHTILEQAVISSALYTKREVSQPVFSAFPKGTFRERLHWLIADALCKGVPASDTIALAEHTGADPVEIINLAAEFPSGGIKDHAKRLLSARLTEAFERGENITPWATAITAIDSVSLEATEDEWPDPSPLPEGLPPVKPLEPDMIPLPLRGWLMDAAERLQIPPDFSTAAAVVALGSIIGRGCGINPKCHDDWLVVPNLWGAVVGRPSLMKTPALMEAFRHLTRLEVDAKAFSKRRPATGRQPGKLPRRNAPQSSRKSPRPSKRAGIPTN